MAYLRDEADALYPTVTAAGPDYKAWAKRLVWRHQHKDRDLLHIQVQFAYEALNMDQPKAGA